SKSTYVNQLESLSKKIQTFRSKLDIFKTRKGVLKQEVSGLKLNIKDAISKEAEKGILIGSIILFLLLIFLLIKYLVRKYMSENELFYTTNKALNFTFITILFLTLLFSYLENVGHLVTILSFASAGIAIALKDWFMSIMGWLVIIFSGSIHVGDRVKVSKDGNEYVGDVVDISILRMTLHEDVTLTTEMLNRRAGRILFIPNNYIFTDIIANYSHSGLKTVWDGIDFMVTFDSDIAKAQSIAKDVSRQYSKGYTDMTRKQLNRLRSKYSMRNTSVEPRIFAFLDENGVRISVWYLTNAYATLTLRSTISMEILAQIKAEDKISIAFPSQSLYMNKPAPIVPEEKKVLPEELTKPTDKPVSKYQPDDWGLY
nr:mechanosensitive ion channel family protein [Campylobacterota bacterium]